MSHRRAIDRNGLEGMPLKLTIVAITLAISSPIIYGGLSTYETSRVESQLRAEASAIADMVKLVFNGGRGNSQLLKVRLRGGMTAHADYILVGDSLGGNYTSCIRYKAKGLPEQTMLVSQPNIPMRSLDGLALKLTEGNYDLMVECKTCEEGDYVQVRVVV
jgi:hypothetical protein